MRKNKLRVTSKGTELRLMEFMQSIALSMDACYLDKDTTALTRDQNYNASFLITRIEVERLCKEFDVINHANLRKKQKSFYSYFQPINLWVSGFPSTLENDPDGMYKFFSGLVRIIEDAHFILNEDTNQKKRDAIIQNAFLTFAEPAGSA